MKQINRKQWTGVVLALLGLSALIVAHVIRSRVGEEMGKVDTVVRPLSGAGQAGRVVGGVIRERASGEAAGYLQTAQLLTIGGIGLVLVGGYLIFLCKKKERS